MSIEMNLSSVPNGGQTTIQDQILPIWNVPSRMAFHIVLDGRLDLNGKLNPVIRRPYTDTSRPYNQLRDFMKHESRQILDDRMPEGVEYGVVTFEGGSKAAREETRRTVEHLSRGWTNNGKRFRCIYGHVADTGFMIFVDAKSSIHGPEDLGISISSDPKAAKRVRRFFASYSLVMKGRVVDRAISPLGMQYAVHMEDGRLFSVLDFDMAHLDGRQRALKEGSCTCRIPGFDGTMATFGGPWGQGKGIAHDNSQVWMYDLVIYDSKKEVVFNGDNHAVYFGVLSHTGLHPFRMDLQTMSNAGLYEDHLVVKAGLDRMDELAELYSGDDENAIIADFAATVKAVDSTSGQDKPVWPLIRAVHLDHQSKTMPALMRRMFNHAAEESVDIVRGRIQLTNGFRGYAFPNPLVDGPDGLPDLGKDTLSGNRDGLRCVCAPDAPEGSMCVGRSPNTNSSEIVEVFNIHPPELMHLKGQGRVFFGADAGDILGKLNGGDMDDMVFVFWGAEYMEKFRQMHYPVQPRIKDQTRKAKSNQARCNEARWKGIGDKWSPCVFSEQLKEFELGTDSLGRIINLIWIDALLSGEHKEAIRDCLSGGRYVIPAKFTPPSLETLRSYLNDQTLAAVGEYERTEAGFLRVASAFNEHKADFVTARAASNSDRMIDWLQMRKGDKATFDALATNAMEALKTPIFPLCFASRIPRDRQESGDYILVETKLCRALAILRSRRDQLIEDNRQLEHMIKRPLAEALVDLYPADDSILKIIAAMTNWWRVQFDNARKRFNGSIPKETFQIAAYGHSEFMEVKLPDGKTSLEEVHQPGLIDFYTNQFSVSGGVYSVSDRPWTVETRRKIGINLANTRYTDNREPRLDDTGMTMSVSDGILINEILHDILDAEEDLGITGQVEFIQLNGYARKKFAKGDQLLVRAKGGRILHMGNGRELSQTRNATIPDGSYMMNDHGIIHVAVSIPELHSDYLSKQVASLTAHGFEFDQEAVC
jgi:hypothetical protein